ncbi:YbaN family protein [Micavibrio aeruginosavorus]|uniref:YbaN family protein n=1 Tax=Micavibrio aeruginosavorus TaxID=349221 RepID=UPI0009DAA325|nr:YbaN family protein [Micavibrio aeruginosavorus]
MDHRTTKTKRLLRKYFQQPPKTFFLCAGWAFLALAFIGVFVPLLPTTPLIIVAAACFSRSSKQMETWLLRHPEFGNFLINWRMYGAIPTKGKWLAFIGCISGFLIFILGKQPGWPLIIIVAVGMLIPLIYIFTRPSCLKIPSAPLGEK